MDNLGELVEKLSIANTKLFKVCDDKANIVKNPAAYSKEDIVKTIAKDISLCEERARLKNAINKVAGINHTEIKSYGD